MSGNFWHRWNLVVNSTQRKRHACFKQTRRMGKHSLLWLTVRSRRVRGMPTSIGNFHSKYTVGRRRLVGSSVEDCGNVSQPQRLKTRLRTNYKCHVTLILAWSCEKQQRGWEVSWNLCERIQQFRSELFHIYKRTYIQLLN